MAQCPIENVDGSEGWKTIVLAHFIVFVKPISE